MSCQNNRCGCNNSGCNGGCNINDGYRSGVRVEVGCVDDVSVCNKPCDTPCDNKARNNCGPPFTPDQIAWIKAETNETFLANNKGLNILNEKVDTMANLSVNFRQEVAQKLVCIESQIGCVSTVECRLAESERALRCENEKMSMLIQALATKLSSFECATAKRFQEQAVAINKLNNGFCAQEEFIKMQTRLDNFQMMFDAQIAQILGSMPQCSSSQARIAPLPLGSPYGSCNPMAGAPLYPAGQGTRCGTNPLGPYGNVPQMYMSTGPNQQWNPPQQNQQPPQWVGQTQPVGPTTGVSGLGQPGQGVQSFTSSNFGNGGVQTSTSTVGPAGVTNTNTNSRPVPSSTMR